MSGVRANGSMFEGLFKLALKVNPDSAFADDLRAVGFDLRDIQSSYDKTIWGAAVDVAHRHCYPELERFVAWRRLGRDFITGYFDTVVGRLIAMVLPLTSPKRFLLSVPAFVRTGTSGVFCDVDLSSDGRSAHLTFDGPHSGTGALMAGVIEVCFERLKTPCTLTPQQHDGDTSSLDVTW